MMLDHIDGGFSILLHVPGFLTPGMPILMDNLTAHAYLPPHKLDHHCKALERPIARIVQIFAKDITLPHLQHVRDYRACSGLPAVTMEVTRAFQMSRESRQELSE